MASKTTTTTPEAATGAPAAPLPGSTTITDPAAVAEVMRAMGLPTDAIPARITVQIPKAGRPAPFCRCGCGGVTGGGVWLPGHDAKHKSALFAGYRAGDKALTEELLTQFPQWGVPAEKATPAPKAEVAAPAA